MDLDEKLTEAIEAIMPADTVWTRDYGRVGIAPEVSDIVNAVLALLQAEGVV